jgi:hypothetical protein
MKLDEWLKQNAARGGWSNRQPLEPPPRFRTRVVAAAWDHMERYAMHMVRRGLQVPARLSWFRAVDRGWSDPTGMVCLVVPHRDAYPEVGVFQIQYTTDPDASCEALETSLSYPLEVYQAWPGSKRLVEGIVEELAPLRRRDGWYGWDAQEVMQLGATMDIVSDAWAHRRYWIGLEAVEEG